MRLGNYFWIMNTKTIKPFNLPINYFVGSIKRFNINLKKEGLKNMDDRLFNELKGDPLYNAVLTATSQKEYDKAVDILLSIRGSQAIELLKKAILLKG